MTLSYKHLLLLGAFFSLLTILFVGQFYDHHGDKALFIKSRPTFSQIFRPQAKNQFPVVSQDSLKNIIDIEDVKTAIRQLERESSGAFFIATMFIEMSILFLLSGCFSLLKKTKFSIRQLIILFSINFFITFFGLSFILFADNATISYTFFVILAITNYLTIIIYNINGEHSKKLKNEISS